MHFMKHLLPIATALMLVACAKETTESYSKFENLALEAWMSQNRPELVDNLQVFEDEDSRFYIDVLEAGNQQDTPLNDTIRWVRFNISGRDLAGNIILTRNAREAELAGTFTKYTHYVPYYMYSGDAYYTLMEGTWLAMRREQVFGADYYQNNKDRLGLSENKYKMRVGDKVTLYMPSSVVGGGLSGDGGYEGQYTLDAGKPLIATLTICDTVKNPLQREALDIDAFCYANGGAQIFIKEDEDDKTDEVDNATEIEGIACVELTEPTKNEDESYTYPETHPLHTAARWVSACDSVAQLYVNHRFDPTNNANEMVYDLDFNKKVTIKKGNYPRYGEMTYGPYHVGVEPYSNEGSVASINQQIAAKLKERFHSDKPYVGLEQLIAEGADSVKLDGTAEIWYIGRFLDGFIFDTNIDEVKEIIYGEVSSTGSALSYTPEEGGLINAFYYAIPNMRYGQWGALITSSTHAYGATGQTGSTTSSSGYSSSYYDYLNYLNYYNYYNSYYGGYGMGGYGGYGGYYGNYYDSYYGGYGYGGYYDPYYSGYYNNYYGTSGTTTTTISTTTEIPSYCPLIFEFYIEPKE